MIDAAAWVPLIRRSMVTGAANNQEHLERCWQLDADSVMLDLEDTVPVAQKPSARAGLVDAVARAARGGADVLVRVNSTWPMIDEDLDAGVLPGVDTVIVPKCEDVADLVRIDDTISRLESERGLAPGSVSIGVLVESVRGYFALRELLAATPRVVSGVIGGEDFTQDIHVEPTAGGEELLLVQQQLVLASRWAGVTPIFGVLGALSTLHDLDAVRRKAAWARQVGFKGSACSTQSHVAIANEAFSPSTIAVAKAGVTIAAYAESTSRGDGRIEVDGAVIDLPVVLRAHKLMAWADACAALDQRKRDAIGRHV